ncbi:(S)-ureidoglycine aminohydrolase [Wukongibacter baidiensis]|uniref:(S)-ureidoglycine aminohydrolase n=1 Tax=Wukongibacter baidiensis TaxID=1723361 RepID=UPI003D7F2B11
MAYPKDHLTTRSIIKHGKYALISPEGRVINVIPGFEGFKMTILASPKLGASFAQYIAEVSPGAKTTKAFGGDGIETFVFLMDGEGELTVTVGDEEHVIKRGGYVYAPADVGMNMRNDSNSTMRILLYKQVYIPVEGFKAWTVCGNINDIEERIYEDMENVFIQDLLPSDLGFDVNMHILSFEPDGSHPFIETHVQEHGAYLLSGQGIYLIGEDWVQVKKEDFIWFGAFTQQGTYCTGRERLSYIYSKDFNRDVIL